MSIFEQHYLAAQAQFNQTLSQNEFLYLTKTSDSAKEQATQKIEAVFQVSTGKLYWLKELKEFFAKHPFAHIWEDGKQHNAVLHTATQLIWSNEGSVEALSLKQANELLGNTSWFGLSEGWKVPTPEQLKQFAMAAGNPYRTGEEFYLKIADQGRCYWLSTQGRVDVDKEFNWQIAPNHTAYLCAINKLWSQAGLEGVITELITRNWTLSTSSGENFVPQKSSQQLDKTNLMAEIQALGYDLVSRKVKESPQIIQNQSLISLPSLLENDYHTCRLPKLEASFLTDPERGMWELWGSSPEFLKEYGLVARDPYQDIQRRAVAIDFGTSSTVVATTNQNGASELLRIGVRDFYQQQEAHHYENPTVLEFLDFSSFTNSWSQQAYRPELDWDWVRASHEAQASFRDNPGDTQVLASILPRLKQWALRDEKHQRVRLTGRKGNEMELLPHTERNPVRGQALEVTENDPLDPVELYAWYLGMAINWRQRGLFLKYYLSFPVKYPLEVKNRILASFRRGLQRSFPQTLIDHYPQVLQEFEVADLASEPTAYAAGALPHLEVELTEEGVPYAVFDFGGGTTDFDFGIWRLSTDAEEDDGYDSVLEHYASSGDNYLGGENLLEHLVYETFKQNLDTLRDKRIQFIKPMDALGFPGSEPFIAPTQAAQTNAVMLAAKLRPFLEGKQAELASQLKLDLINTQGEKATCELLLDTQALDALLRQRIQRGVLSFLHELKKVANEFPAKASIQLLFAGNASHSRHISALFADESKLWNELCKQVFTDKIPVMDIHQPLPVDMAKPYAPTSKTGVALGLLLVAPGEDVLLTNRLHEANDGQAPFGWYVGRLRQNQLKPTLSPGSDYQQWQAVGPIKEGVLNLYYSTSPRTELGLKRGDPELKMQRLDLHEAPVGSRLYVRALEPNTIELVAALELPAITDAASKTLVLE
ncbi:MAG: hypothetical protein GX029_05880 [Pseudomonadaceae bacterium]|nr:hypothetical protein [Pseudomonadaceae bacterium]